MPDETSQQMRTNYLSVEELRSGMVVARPLTSGTGNVMNFFIPPHTVLTDGLIQQISAHHGAIVCVFRQDSRTAEQISEELSRARARLNRVFGNSKLEPEVSSLLNCLQQYYEN